MPRAETEVLKLRGEQSLDILRLDRGDQLPRQEPQMEGVAVQRVLLGEIIDPSLFTDGSCQTVEARDPEEAGRTVWWRLAVQGSGLFIVMLCLDEVTQDQDDCVDCAGHDDGGTEHDALI